MVEPAAGVDSLDVVVLPPTQRDGEYTAGLLARVGVSAVIVRDVASAAARLANGAGVLVLTDITLATTSVQPLTDLLLAQAEWSNIPVLFLCAETRGAAAQHSLLDVWPNVTVLDRPGSVRGLLSAVRAALRTRQAQYRLRDQIVSLLLAEEALRQSDRRKDEFLATLAHELRNPLAPILNGTALLGQSAIPTEEARRVQAMVQRQLKLLVRLVDDLLDVSRIATGKLVLQRDRVDLRVVAQLALESSEGTLAIAGHQLRVRLPDQPVWVDGDASRLTQAVSNLVTNAIKYTPHGGRIDVTVASSQGRGVIKVADDGIGIPPGMLDRVFELFAQVNTSLDRSQGGLGIGLALVRQLVELHGGTTEVDSGGADRGSTFTICLPISDAGPARQGVEGHPAEPVPVDPLRVVIVDDNADAADSLALLVGMMGHESRVAHSGEAGLRLVESFSPDVVFCDLGMPGMNGHEVARRLTSHPHREALLLVALTGWGTEQDLAQTRTAGFDRHLVKPAPVDQLSAILSAASRERREPPRAEA